MGFRSQSGSDQPEPPAPAVSRSDPPAEGVGSRTTLHTEAPAPSEPSISLAERSDTPLIRAAVTGAQQGDMDALHFLYVRYADDVLRCVRGLVKDHHEAEDITQDVFVKLIRVIGKYEPREVPFAAWIHRVARNVALDHLRSRKVIPCEEVRLRDEAHGQETHQRARDLRQALAELPDEQRQVLVLRHIVGLSPVEIAELLDKTESSIHGLHHRGRAGFRSALEELGATPVVSPSLGDAPARPAAIPEEALLQLALPERAPQLAANS